MRIISIVPNLNSLQGVLKLVIQPNDAEAYQRLTEIGFSPIPDVPQLLYLLVTSRQVANIFLQISCQLSEVSQSASRFVLTRSPLNSRALLIDFLQAHPLISITLSAKHAWFLRVLTKEGLFFKYQPIFDLASGTVEAYECLACARTEQGVHIGGQQLLDAALSMQLTHEFDELARMSCLEAIAQVKGQHQFFINVLPNAISRNPHFLEQNFSRVLELGLSPEQIVFELTEVEALVRCPELLQIVNQIREWGFGLAIDDFCGSVSVDHYLMELQPDVIKFDRRLIHECSHYPMKQILIKSLLQSAHELNIKVLAEGLEDHRDIEFCRAIGIDYGQGFGLALPSLTLQPQSLNLIEFPVAKASQGKAS